MRTKNYIILIAMAFYLQSCASTTRILSQPTGAKVYINDEYAGTTPLRYRDRKPSLMSTAIELKKEGYKVLRTDIHRDSTIKIIPIVLSPFTGGFSLLWILGYKSKHFYELEEDTSGEE